MESASDDADKSRSMELLEDDINFLLFSKNLSFFFTWIVRNLGLIYHKLPLFTCINQPDKEEESGGESVKATSFFLYDHLNAFSSQL